MHHSTTQILTRKHQILAFRTRLAVSTEVTRWSRLNGVTIMRYALAAIFIWFGMLKPLGISPAYELVERTVFWFSADWFVPVLGCAEVALGIGLLVRPLLGWTILALLAHMAGTALPFVVCPDVCFTQFPFGLTLEGQYIVKNLIIVGSAIVIVGSMPRKTPR